MMIIIIVRKVLRDLKHNHMNQTVAMKAYVCYFHAVLSSALCRREWTYCLSGHLRTGKTVWMEDWVRPRSVLDMVTKKIPSPTLSVTDSTSP
jgi:tRNA A37 threonylcarbamoyladenosine biosynthesis protein TsaE